MTPVSLMPPVDYCPSCEGQKAEGRTSQIGEQRAKQAELQAATDPTTTSSPGAPPAAEAWTPTVEGDRPKPVAGAVQSLLAPDLAVQASLARPSVETGAGGDAEALRLRAAQAYQLS